MPSAIYKIIIGLLTIIVVVLFAKIIHKVTLPDQTMERGRALSSDLEHGVFKEGDNADLLLEKYPELTISYEGSSTWYSYSLLDGFESVSIKALNDKLVQASHHSCTYDKSFFGPDPRGDIRKEKEKQMQAELQSLINSQK